MKHIKLFENFDNKSIEDICKRYNIINYTINEDGSIDVEGGVDLSVENLEELPLVFNNVSGDFDCSGNMLTTLKGSPKIVGSDFICSNNCISDLYGCPIEVKNDFICSHNILKNLKNSPKIVGGSFYCTSNALTSLEGAPSEVKRFSCTGNNNLRSLLYTPIINVVGAFPETIQIIYDLLKSNLDYVPNFYDFGIIIKFPPTSTKSLIFLKPEEKFPVLNIKRLNKFLDLYGFDQPTPEQLKILKQYYIFA